MEHFQLIIQAREAGITLNYSDWGLALSSAERETLRLQEGSVFFKLPRVVRMLIYTFVLPDINPNEQAIVYGAEQLKTPVRLTDYPPFMYTCKQVFREMRPVACADVYMSITGIMFNKSTIWGFGRLSPEYLQSLSIVYHMDIDRLGIPEALAWIGSRAPSLRTLRLRFQGHPRTWLDLPGGVFGPATIAEQAQRKEDLRLELIIELLWFVLRGMRSLEWLDLGGVCLDRKLFDALANMKRILGHEVEILFQTPDLEGPGPLDFGLRRHRRFEHDLDPWFAA
ncbi:hypothetical protein F4810DRAFT_725974 [Camillea tinctor]|nr:hypothetical protein F4810DRAFT_725974 [Camillea tinctor]